MSTEQEETTSLTYVGHNRSGTVVTGRTDIAPVTLIEGCYNRGYRDLSVKRAGEEVGAICRHPDSGRRIWWSGR